MKRSIYIITLIQIILDKAIKIYIKISTSHYIMIQFSFKEVLDSETNFIKNIMFQEVKFVITL